MATRQDRIDEGYRDRETGMQSIRMWLLLILAIGCGLSFYIAVTGDLNFMKRVLFFFMGLFWLWVDALLLKGILNSAGEISDNRHAQRQRQAQEVEVSKPVYYSQGKPVTAAQMKANEEKRQQAELERQRDKYNRARREELARKREYWKKKKEERNRRESARKFEAWAEEKGIPMDKEDRVDYWLNQEKEAK